MAEQTPVVLVDTVILKGSGTYKDGEIFTDVAYRVNKRLWKKEMNSSVDGFKKWMSKHDPRFGDEFNVTLVREESIDANDATQKPEV